MSPCVQGAISRAPAAGMLLPARSITAVKRRVLLRGESNHWQAQHCNTNKVARAIKATTRRKVGTEAASTLTPVNGVRRNRAESNKEEANNDGAGNYHVKLRKDG